MVNAKAEKSDAHVVSTQYHDAQTFMQSTEDSKTTPE